MEVCFVANPEAGGKPSCRGSCAAGRDGNCTDSEEGAAGVPSPVRACFIWTQGAQLIGRD
eukprot:scaffold707_cov399-Prasinococcus_capsulatus_cf.AAC.33